ncbi:hypothetical protein I5T99_12595 [Stenotrophomonas maltophilia]|nr:hypothetical protein [Stenotrophomonas maltophilia]
MNNESSNRNAMQPAAALADNQAVRLAQASAFAHCNQHPYLPQTHEQANSWQPHEWVVAAIHTAALMASQPVFPRFQADVADWMGQCFLPSLYSNMTERGDRLLEEVLELLQAHGYDSARVPTLVNYVFGRPVGEPAQEVGGVMVTLAAYCSVAGLSMQADGQAELDRINQPDVMARIRAKQEAKNALRFDSPLPGCAAQPAQAADLVQPPMFYIQDTRQFVGNCPVWWGPNGGGYVTRLDEAGRYTEQEAITQNRTRTSDIPWPCAEIDALARRTVDCQHMRTRGERLAELAVIYGKAVGNG